MDYETLGAMARKLNALSLKEFPLDYDDSELRSLLASQTANSDTQLSALAARVARIENLYQSIVTLLQQILDGQGTAPTLGNNVLLDDGAA